MNIFALDYDPIKAARMISDIHLPKMCLESTQMWSTLAWDSGNEAWYLPVHEGHPCNIWLKLSRENRIWMRNYTSELFKEFELRRRKEHLSKSIFYDTLHKIFEEEQNNLKIEDLFIKKPALDVIKWLDDLDEKNIIVFSKKDGYKISFTDYINFVDFYPAMPEECRIGKNPVEMYRNYYRTEKKEIIYWNWISERGKWYNNKDDYP